MTQHSSQNLEIRLPELSLVVLVGVSGSGKSTFVRRHFKPTEILSSDACRALVSDDQNDQTVTRQAFEVLHYIAEQRLSLGKLVVVDATNLQQDARRGLLRLARDYHVIPMAVVLDLPEGLCRERNSNREDRNFGSHVIRNQARQLRRSMKSLKREGFRQIHRLRSVEEVDAVTFSRQPMWTDRRRDSGPFDIIGDVHGCFDELLELLGRLGYGVSKSAQHSQVRYQVTPPSGRKVIFLGDLVDRGPNSPEVLRLVMDMVDAGNAICVPGNHEVKLERKLSGRKVNLTHGLAETMEQLADESDEFLTRVKSFFASLISHFILDDGRLVVAHAGLKEAFQGRASGAVRNFALYGETTGETDEYGLPVRYQWASDYKGSAMVVYGHTPVLEPEWLNGTICIDTGCVFGGKLTALRYPEKELLQAPAARQYYEPIKPLDAPSASSLTAQQAHDDMLDIEDVWGKRRIHTQWDTHVLVTEEQSLAALEVMSRFAVHPKWINYLPPTMSPCETSSSACLLEHPEQAFDYYRKQGIATVICEEKHMGSRAVIQICQDAEAARNRFGVETGETGVCYTRTGRRFFDDQAIETEFLERLRNAVSQAGIWDALQTTWLTLDCELMPWSMKAMELILNQYAPVGTAARASLASSIDLLEAAKDRGLPVESLLEEQRERLPLIDKYVKAYQGYQWQVGSVDNLRLAPFHLMASEGCVHADKDHHWHMQIPTKLGETGDKIFVATSHQAVTLGDDQACNQAIDWWQRLTENGGEGMVVKPLEFMAKGRKGFVQPAIKCRGAEYLRIIYGPEYSRSDHLERLKSRTLGIKRRLALREFMLGLEGLYRFVNESPLRQVHECAFGVLALESEPVDPRL